MSGGEQRAGVDLTNLDQPLSPDAAATKRDLVNYLDAVADRILPGLIGRPLTVMRVLRGQALVDSGLAGVVKTSGAKGLHVFVPIDDSAPVDDVAAATRALAARAEALDPDLATTAFIVEDRGGKVFVDSTRAGGSTVVAAYSPRLRPGTPVSFPLDWSDL